MYKIHTYTKMNLSTVKWAQWDKTQSRELLGLFICVHRTVHNCCTQYCTEHTWTDPLTIQTITIAPVMCIWGKVRLTHGIALILYSGPRFPLKIALLHRGISIPIWYMVPWANPSPHSKRHLDWLSRFYIAHAESAYTLQWAAPFPFKVAPFHDWLSCLCRAHNFDRQTDRQTDHATVCNNRLHRLHSTVMRPISLIKSATSPYIFTSFLLCTFHVCQ